MMTLGPGDWALLLGGGSCATAVPAHPERIPVRGAGDIPDPWGHQKRTSDPADTRGERGDPLSRAWPVGVPGDTSAPPPDPPRGHVLAPSPALPPAPAASSDTGPGDATGVLAGTSEPGRFWRGVGLPYGGLQPWWGCWNGEGRTDGRTAAPGVSGAARGGGHAANCQHQTPSARSTLLEGTGHPRGFLSDADQVLVISAISLAGKKSTFLYRCARVSRPPSSPSPLQQLRFLLLLSSPEAQTR